LSFEPRLKARLLEIIRRIESEGMSAERHGHVVARSFPPGMPYATSKPWTRMLHARGRLHPDAPFEPWLAQTAALDVVEDLPIDVPVVLALDGLPQTG